MSVQFAGSPDSGPRRADGSLTTVGCDLDRVSNSHVRGLVRGLLAGRTGLVVEDATLVADELVSNAHCHGAAPRHCRLTLLERGGLLRIEVDDASPVAPRMRTPEDSGGRGLLLVDRLASRWGLERRVDRKTVWAELALDGPGSSGHVPHMTAVPDRSS